MKKIKMMFISFVFLCSFSGTSESADGLRDCMVDCLKTKPESQCKNECGAPDASEKSSHAEGSKEIGLRDCMVDCLKTKPESQCKSECGAPDVVTKGPELSKKDKNWTPIKATAKKIVINLNDEKGDVRNILGTVTPPLSNAIIKERKEIGSKLRSIGVKHIALTEPKFDVDIYLDNLFLDNSKDANDRGNYNLFVIDRQIDSIIKNEMIPRFMFHYDINCYKDCGKTSPVKAEAFTPEDMDKWINVAINIIKHFNGLFDVPNQGRKFSKGDVRYFNIWDEPGDFPDLATLKKLQNELFGKEMGHNLPLWTGNFNDYWDLYVKFVNKVETDPEMSSIKDIIKIGGPNRDYGGIGGRWKFADKIIQSKTKPRLDFINMDNYFSNFYHFVYAQEGMKDWEEKFNEIKNSDEKYKELEWHISTICFQNKFQWHGYCDTKDLFCSTCSDSDGIFFCNENGVNYESPFGASLLMNYLIYAEDKKDVASFVWDMGQGDYAIEPAVPMAIFTLFNGDAKLMYSGLTFKAFSKLLSFDEMPAIKVSSSERVEYYDGPVKSPDGSIKGYREQSVLQVLSAKSRDENKIRILISNWNLDPKENHYNSYDIKIKNTKDDEYHYKVYLIDKDHTYPDRCNKYPTYKLPPEGMPDDFKEKVTKIIETPEKEKELINIYCRDRKYDKSIRYEDELGIDREGTIVGKNGEINMNIMDVNSAAVHLIEFVRK